MSHTLLGPFDYVESFDPRDGMKRADLLQR